MIRLRFPLVIEILRNVSIFNEASDELLVHASNLFFSFQVERDEAICRVGELGRKLFIIRSGQVRISITDPGNGHEITLNYLGPGDYFGEMSLLTGEPVSANVTATLPTTLSALSGEDFNRLCEENPILYRGMSLTLSHRLRETNLKRFESRRGQIIRITTDRLESDLAVFYGQIRRIALHFHAVVHNRILVVIPVPDKAGFKEEIWLPQGIAPSNNANESPDLPDHLEQAQRLCSDLADRMKGHSFHLASRDPGVDVLFWSETTPESVAGGNQPLNEILSCLRDVYRHLLVAQITQTFDEVLADFQPDDHVALLIDLSSEASQRPATEEEYNRWVPEGNRYPPARGEMNWVLSRTSLDRLQHLAGKVRAGFPEKNRLHILLLHHGTRPLLDLPLIKMTFLEASVHPLPLDALENHRENQPPVTPPVSTAIQLSRNPERSLGRIARDLGGRRVGLALGGGGARGLAHIGVIKVLEDEGIPLDLLAGSSFGSVVAAAYGVGRSAQRLVDDMRHHWKALGNFLLDILDYNIPRTALLRGRKIRRMIEIAMADEMIEECPIPVYVVCTDLITGHEIVLDRGRLGKAIWASGSLPGIFSPVRWGSHLLVDGAVLNKVPARVLREKGADLILAVNVTPERDTGLENSNNSSRHIKRWLSRIPALERFFQGPNIMRILSRSLSISGLHQSRIHSDTIDVEIKPHIENFDFLRFDLYDQIVEAGMEATRQALPEIRAALENNHG